MFKCLPLLLLALPFLSHASDCDQQLYVDTFEKRWEAGFCCNSSQADQKIHALKKTKACMQHAGYSKEDVILADALGLAKALRAPNVAKKLGRKSNA